MNTDIDAYSGTSHKRGCSDMGRCSRALSSSCSDLCGQLPRMGSLVRARVICWSVDWAGIADWNMRHGRMSELRENENTNFNDLENSFSFEHS